MTYTDPTPPAPTSGPTPTSRWELCDHCQAPLADRQRYCVVCGARRAHADDPAARYFVEATRRARASEAAPPSDSTSGSPSSSSSRLRYAIVLALLPLVAAIGVMVGGNNNGDQQLVDALKAQKAPVVNVVGAGAGGTAAAADTTGSADETTARTRARSASGSSAANGKVIARTRYGSARSLTDSRVTAEQIEESRRALEHIVNSKGKEYVEQQRNLPDQIVIP
jgi:hypothetical protein